MCAGADCYIETLQIPAAVDGVERCLLSTMLLNSRSSAALHSSSNVPRSAGAKLQRALRRMDAMPYARARADDGPNVFTTLDTLRLLVMVTPRIFTVVVRSMSGIGGGGCTRIFRRLSKKTTSGYFDRFTFGLLALAHASPFDSSACLLLAYGWNVPIVSELDHLDHLVAVRHCCVYDVCPRTDGGTLD